MYLEGLFSSQGNEGPFLDLLVEKEIAVYEKALISIGRPDPAVSLDAVQEKFPAVQVEGIGRHIPDFVDDLLAAVEEPLYSRGRYSYSASTFTFSSLTKI